MTVSLHSRSNFPFRKKESTIDVELADETIIEQRKESRRSGLVPIALKRKAVLLNFYALVCALQDRDALVCRDAG